MVLDYPAGKSLLLRDSSGTTALTLDSSQNATFAGTITFVKGNWQKSSDGNQRMFFEDNSISYWKGGKSDNTGSSHIFRNYADSAVLTLDNTSSKVATFSGPIKLANAYVAGAPAATGYVTIQDSNGTTYKVLVST